MQRYSRYYSRRRTPRWPGVATSLVLLGMVVGALALQSGKVRSHIPGMNGAVPTVTPAGVVISLSQITGEQPVPTARVAIAFPAAATPAASATDPVASSPLVTEPTATDVSLAPTVAVSGTGIAPTSFASPAVSPAIAAGTPVPTINPSLVAPVVVSASATAPRPTAPAPVPTVAPTAVPQPTPLPAAVFLEPMAHWYQGWNQCAEMAASMALSYFGIKEDPNLVTAQLRPNNGPKGTKNVESYRIAEFINTQGVKAQVFEGGSIERVKRLVASGVPVIVGQWQNRADHAGIGHWRVVRGYDDAKQIFILNDSMLDPAFQIKYSEFDDLWPLYDYVYIPVWNDKLAPSVQRIMSEEMDPKVNVARAISYMQSRAEQQPQNAEIQFGLGGAYFKAGNYEKAAEQFHKAKTMGLLNKTPWALWYQSWPVVALGKIGADDEALQLAQDNIKSAGVFALMHYDRAVIFEKRGDMGAAKREYQSALVDDKNLKEAQDALARLG